VRAAEQDVHRRIEQLLAPNGKRSVREFHQQLGKLLWEYCGMARNADGLRHALERIPELRAEFWHDVRVPGSAADFNQSLEYAGRVADFMEFAELMCLDAQDRQESCGGHFRTEFQTADGEARRNDDEYAHASVWEFTGVGQSPRLHRESLTFENVPLSQRSYR
jgi:succinate dehydrogenase / fumarate reductase flavoprotein subunit